jgi:hypothetical protein
LKIDVFRAACEDAIFTGHEPPSVVFSGFAWFARCTIVHVFEQV